MGCRSSESPMSFAGSTGSHPLHGCGLSAPRSYPRASERLPRLVPELAPVPVVVQKARCVGQSSPEDVR
jgi:hypothetical protein